MKELIEMIGVTKVSITMEKCSIFGKTVHLYSLN